ncbi:MAG: nickel pincer cofactor biosynthesis protein LarC [Candidatus Heimdallarchaeota archaeon]|nr:MAG: nickel pincer cofactor biosynthesis protein LarC [Candidatus Heimdallarchaeota archaeon]
MSVVIIDASASGASGDLLIASMLDTQEDTFRDEFCQRFQKLLSKYDPDFQLRWLAVNKQAISGTQIRTSATKEFLPQEMSEILEKVCNKLNLSSKGRETATTALSLLIEAEKRVHGKNRPSEHFHELATIDTVFDIIGFTYLWENLGFFQAEITILPIAVGGGLIEITHGRTSVPAPATAEIIRQSDLLIKGGPVEGELLTPTGAALLASLQATSTRFLPLMKFQKIGKSFGTRDSKDDSITGLQIIQGIKESQLQKEEINILETNVDDVDGETLGYLFDILFEEDLVLDLTIINTISKKNRPGFLIQVLVEPSKTLQVTTVLTRELGTLGVRVLQGFRHIIPRKLITQQIKVVNEEETVQVKRGYLNSELISEKVEYEDLKRIARRKGIPLREIQKRILSEIQRQDEENA